MHKVVIHKAGGYEQLKLETHPVPKPGDRQVLIRTEAVGVNYADICVRWGVYESARRFVGWPITPGFEYAGRVEEVGRGVAHVKPGDPVFGLTFFDGYSTHVCAPADLVWPKPEALDFEAAAGFLAVHLTAYHGLLQNVVIRPGMRVLVHSAAGGVGSALVQLCKLHDLHVTPSSTSPRNRSGMKPDAYAPMAMTWSSTRTAPKPWRRAMRICARPGSCWSTAFTPCCPSRAGASIISRPLSAC
jgi:NADPH:quinone reductase-like Zn-dependent oxidoreductase